jgi:hypothetical protein
VGELRNDRTHALAKYDKCSGVHNKYGGFGDKNPDIVKI